MAPRRDCAYETFKGWFRGGFWRTRYIHERLFLVFFILLFTLCGMASCAPHNYRELSHRHHNTTASHNLDLIPNSIIDNELRDDDDDDVVIPLATNARHRRDVHARHNRRRRPHSINPRNTPHRMCYEDVASKAYLAGTVFDGKARSRSPVKNGVYNVTFVVQSYLKGGEVGLPRSPVRLQFAEKRDGEPECPNAGGGGGAVGVVKANITRGGKYVVFVDKVGPHSFVARGEPAIRNKINVQAVKDILCQNCVRKPALSGFGDVALRVNQKLRLVCRARGNPQPLLHWYKDGVRMHKSKETKIRQNKRRLTLVVTKVALNDAGRYECRGTSVSGASDRLSATVTVTTDPRLDNATIAWRLPKACPFDHYCMNEGTCTYYETVGELSCSCAEGYKGTRCEEKDVYNRANGSMYRPMSYFCKLGISSSYYC